MTYLQVECAYIHAEEEEMIQRRTRSCSQLHPMHTDKRRRRRIRRRRFNVGRVLVRNNPPGGGGGGGGDSTSGECLFSTTVPG